MSVVKQYLEADAFTNFDDLLQLVTMYYTTHKPEELMRYLSDQVMTSIHEKFDLLQRVTFKELKAKLFLYMSGRFYSSKYLSRHAAYELLALLEQLLQLLQPN